VKDAADFPLLRRLCGAYLHQDFDVHGARPEAAVTAFAESLDPAGRAALRAEVRRFLARHKDEPSRLAALERLRFAVDLSHFGYAGVGEFLRAVAKAVG
jgi:hypothetical protein